MRELFENVQYHPYTRYGLAIALFLEEMTSADLETLTDKDIRTILIRAIEDGLGEFRMETYDDPKDSKQLRYKAIPLRELRNNSNLVQAAGLAKQGKYLYPTILTTDGSAKDTFTKAEDIIKRLRTDKLYSTGDMSRSFAPSTSKINNGKASQSPPKGNLIEIACSVITTVTSIKPAAWINKQNTIIIPDLPLQELINFIALFDDMYHSEVGNLLQVSLDQSSETDDKTNTIQKKKEDLNKSEYKRPPIFRGNYPFAPRNIDMLGAVGLIGAIGRWARTANMEDKAKDVLISIAGTDTINGRPLYMITYEKLAMGYGNIMQIQFTHHIVDLSLNGELSEILDSLTHRTILYSEIDKVTRQWDSPAFTHFYMMLSRFLQLFTQPSFQDFLACRAEYPYELHTIFKVYFMEQRKISEDVVSSARALGQWLNYIAYRVAVQDLGKTKSNNQKISEAKAKVLILFENIIMSSKTPQEMIGRLASQAGRLFTGDIPPEATAYIDEVNSGNNLRPVDIQYLLLAYIRLRSPINASTIIDREEPTDNTDQTSEENMTEEIN